jgi:hypothetical protein
MSPTERIMKESEFYADIFRFSYSSLNKLLYSPKTFYNEYVLGIKEIRTDAHLIEGKLTHYLMLEDASFTDRFILSPESLPTGNSKDVVDVVYAVVPEGEDKPLSYYSDVILETLRQINLHQKLVDDKKPDKDGVQKTGDEKRLEKILTKECISYFDFLKTKAGRDIIDQSTLDKCSQAAEALKANPKIVELLGQDRVATDEFATYNELPIFVYKYKDYPFGIKGILDNLVVDVEQKLVRINDVKTSSKSISEFPEAVVYWKYWLQAAIYVELAKDFLSKVIDDTWTIEFNFIVIDKYNQVYPFKVSEDSMRAWSVDLECALQEAKYHYESHDYTLPYRFVAEEVLL